jgi:hypothetical protein
MTYTVEIEIPRSGNWFKYVFGLESEEEAENIKSVAKGKLKARVCEE